MRRIISLFFIILLVFACNKEKTIVEYRDTEQKLNVNDKDINGNKVENIKLVAHIPDSIIIGRQALFKLTSPSNEQKLVQAYFNCPVDTSSYIDTVSYRIEDCDKGLALIKDTIVVALKPQKSGVFAFPHTIVAISRGNDGVFRYHTGTFEYKVIEK